MASYPPFFRQRSAARSPTEAALRFLQTPRYPGDFEVNPTLATLSGTGLGFLSDTEAPLGVLPVEQWGACDAAVARTWELAAALERSVNDRWYVPGVGVEKGMLLNAVANFKARVQDWSTRLQKLKHDPSYGKTFSSPQAAIDAWKAWAAPTGD